MMSTSFDQRLLNLLKIELPVIQAPMAGNDTPRLAAAVSGAGGLGSLACALLSPDQIRAAWSAIRQLTAKPVNLNFFCHTMPARDAAQENIWRAALGKYYQEFQLDPDTVSDTPLRMPFDEAACAVVEELKPEVISFHFGLPPAPLLLRAKSTGAKIISSATTLEEAIWLEAQGCDAIIAQGKEAGGHRGMFLTKDLHSQIPTLMLLKQMAGRISVPVIAAGGIATADDVAEVLAAGAAAAQLGTAYLFTPEAIISPLHLSAMKNAANTTTITNLFSGRPARGIVNRFITEAGPMSGAAPAFPYAAKMVGPLRKKSEATGSPDFVQMWAGEAHAKCEAMPAAELTRKLAAKVK